MFRYPGGKSRLYKHIEPYLMERYNGSLIIPFVGAGHVTTRFLKKKTPNFVWLNDIDFGITSFWKAVYFYPLKFLNKLKKYEPIKEDFYIYKDILDDVKSAPAGVEDITDIALIKLVIHQISYSGLGCMAGGPIGGKNQTSKYDVGCRWNPTNLAKSIWETHLNLKKSEVRITSWDFRQVLADNRCDGTLYLDPPYYEQGSALYTNSLTKEDHWELSELLFNRKEWVLSYDDNSFIHNLYNFASIHSLDTTYSIKGARQRKELLIVS